MEAPLPQLSDDHLAEAVRVSAARLGSQTALADELGVSATSVSRWIKGAGRPELIYCLRIAQISGISAADVLKAAGWTSQLALIEACFGTARPEPEMSIPERAMELLNTFAKLTERDRQAVIQLAKVLAGLKHDTVEAAFKRKAVP